MPWNLANSWEARYLWHQFEMIFIQNVGFATPWNWLRLYKKGRNDASCLVRAYFSLTLIFTTWERLIVITSRNFCRGILLLEVNKRILLLFPWYLKNIRLNAVWCNFRKKFYAAFLTISLNGMFSYGVCFIT